MRTCAGSSPIRSLQAFKNLGNDEERDAFIENFWLRRNPNPDDPENTYREEHYARIAYANDHFAAGKPGWKTDRGHIYIAYGKPDNIDSHPSGGSYERPMEEGGGNTSTFPFEIWHYRYLEGIGDNVDIEFVDTCMCGDYHMTIDRSEKDALKHVPGAGQTLAEQQGQSTKADRFSGGGLEQLGSGPMSTQNQSKQFDRLDRYAKLMAAPEIKFKDLEAFMSTSKILTGPPFLFGRSHRLCEGDERYDSGSNHATDPRPRHYLQYQGRRLYGDCECPWARLEPDRQADPDV